MSGAPTIRLLIDTDLDAWLSMSARVEGQSGQDGDPIFTPLEERDPGAWPAIGESRLAEWHTLLTDPNWSRNWGAFIDGELVGDLSLRGGSLPSSMHRVSLGIGIDRSYRSRGIGSLMMREAIDWASSQPLIDWIDLGVFSGNPRAEALYRDLGFEQWAVNTDAFRVAGVTLDDILMRLWVGTK